MSNPYEGDSQSQNVPGLSGKNTTSGLGVSGISKDGPGVSGITTNGIAGVQGEGSKNGVWGNSTNPNGAGVFGSNNSGDGVLGTSGTGHGLAGTSNTGDGIFGVGGANGIHGETNSNQNSGVWARNLGAGTGLLAESAKGIAIHGETPSDQNPAIWARNLGAGTGLLAESAKGTALIARTFNPALLAAQLFGNVECTGDITLTNQDCAEDFDITAEESAEPGTVMVLGQDGALSKSGKEYDKRVVGIVSGAGEFRPAIVLGKQGDAQRKRAPIALIGKAYCKVDASYGSIEVGDLLTTSATRGHAMKAKDPLRGFGSIIGKALSPLDFGCGLIPVLITLQ